MFHRGGMYAIFGLIGLIFALAAVGTDIARFDNDAKADVWKLCAGGAGGNAQGSGEGVSAGSGCQRSQDIQCSSLKTRYQAMEAFYVLTIIFIFLAIVFAICDYQNVHGFRHFTEILLTLAFLTIACSIIGWALAISNMTTTLCGGKLHDAPGFKWWASPFLLIITTVCGMIMFCQAFRHPHSATTR